MVPAAAAGGEKGGRSAADGNKTVLRPLRRRGNRGKTSNQLHRLTRGTNYRIGAGRACEMQARAGHAVTSMLLKVRRFYTGCWCGRRAPGAAVVGRALQHQQRQRLCERARPSRCTQLPEICCAGVEDARMLVACVPPLHLAEREPLAAHLPYDSHNSTRETSTRRSGRRQMQVVEPEHLIVKGLGGGSRHPKCHLSILELHTLLP